MASVFTKIINGDIPCYKVAEDEKHIAFLDINPVAEGHTLVVPKKEEDYIFEMSDEDYTDLHNFAKKVAKGMKKAMPCKRIAEAVLGLEVPHVHIHLVPINNEGDMDFRKKKELNPDEMKEIAGKLSAAMD